MLPCVKFNPLLIVIRIIRPRQRYGQEAKIDRHAIRQLEEDAYGKLLEMGLVKSIY
jgi:hypothetical protein